MVTSNQPTKPIYLWSAQEWAESDMAEEYIMSLRIDSAFRKLFGNPSHRKIRIALISSVLKIPQDDIIDLYKIGEDIVNDKTSEEESIDFRVLIRQTQLVDIELKMESAPMPIHKSLYYWTKLYTKQFSEKGSEDRLCKCITINILNFLQYETTKLHTILRLKDTFTGDLVSDLFESHHLELPKLGMESIIKDPSDPMIQWMEFINSDRRSDMEKMAVLNPDIRWAFEKLKEISREESFQKEYTLRQLEIATAL